MWDGLWAASALRVSAPRPDVPGGVSWGLSGDVMGKGIYSSDDPQKFEVLTCL
jgi:hypothetical protein